MPFLNQATSNGTVVLGFSSQIQAFNATDFIRSYKELKGRDVEETTRLLRQLQFQDELDTAQALGLSSIDEQTSILRMSSSISMELIPGTDAYLDKKEFRWDLISFGTD